MSTYPRKRSFQYFGLIRTNPHISPVSATASQVVPWLRYVSVPGTAAQLWSPQRVKNTTAVANLTCLATKGLTTPRDDGTM
jgi:hypothetical protein